MLMQSLLGRRKSMRTGVIVFLKPGVLVALVAAILGSGPAFGHVALDGAQRS
jgi:hypothetical protein